MKALTIHQPWASALATGMKRFETRPRVSHHRGPIAIHAGKIFNVGGFGNTEQLGWAENLIRPLTRRWITVDQSDFVVGAVIAIADMTDCQQMDEEFIAAQTDQERLLGDWTVGKYAYKLENVRPVGPHYVSGKQGMWNWDDPNGDG